MDEARNLLANCVRESGDHGPFNSWVKEDADCTVILHCHSFCVSLGILHINVKGVRLNGSMALV